jgi:hypothetical protein
MDEAAPQRLSLHILLTLVVCACSLAVHFVGEGLAPAAADPGVISPALGGCTHLDDGDCEDSFVFPSTTNLPVKYSAAHVPSTVPSGACSFLILPLLPPPNF